MSERDFKTLVRRGGSAMSDLEAALAFQLRAYKVAGWQQEFLFHPARKWRFDFCFPALKLAVELQGGIWLNGGHNRGRGFSNDCQKMNAALLLGWRVLTFTGDMVKDGTAIEVVRQAVDMLEAERCCTI